MRKNNIVRMAAVCMAAMISFSPVNAYAAALRIGSSGSDVRQVQTILKDMGYFTYPKITGYYGSITKNAVIQFQKEQGLETDGIVGRITINALKNWNAGAAKESAATDGTAINSNNTAANSNNTTTNTNNTTTNTNNTTTSNSTTEASKNTETSGSSSSASNQSNAALIKTSTVSTSVSSSKIGALDWFTKVQYIFKKGDIAKITDVVTGKTFYLKRTFGHNHADVEPLTKEDTKTILSIWGSFSWKRRAVIVEVNGYILAGSLNAMPHAGVDSAPALSKVSGRSCGYGYGNNLDAVKNNGVSGVMDLHFKNSKTHRTNSISTKHQEMVAKAAEFLSRYYSV